MEPLYKFMEKQDVLISKSLVNVDEGIIPLKYLNLRTESLKLYKGSVVATIEKVDETECTDCESVSTINTCNTNDKNESPEHLKQIINRVHKSVSIEEKQILADLLREFQNSFSSFPADMGTTDLVHHINTRNAPPIKQPPRRIPMVTLV